MKIILKKGIINRSGMYLIGLFLISIFLFQGCVSIKRHAVGIEPSARPVINENYKIIKDAEVSDSSFKLLWIFPVTPEPKINEVIDKMIKDSGGDNLIDVKIWHERQYWASGTVDIIHVNGKIIRYEK
jgi:hypothetical protein